MITASELAGFVAAHAIWCVSDADGFVPMMAFTTEDGQRKLERLVFDDAGAAVEHGRKRLEEDPFSADDGVLAYNGRITFEAGKMDAIILEMRSYAFPWARAAIAVPYTSVSSGRFRVHEPELIEWRECDDFDSAAAMEAFFRGVESHQQGAKVWDVATDALGSCCHVFFRRGACDLRRAEQELRKCKLTVRQDGSSLLVGTPESPTYRVSLVGQPHVLEEARRIAQGTEHERALGQCDARFEIAIPDLDEALDEINTLIDVQQALQTASSGYLFCAWNGAIDPP